MSRRINPRIKTFVFYTALLFVIFVLVNRILAAKKRAEPKLWIKDGLVSVKIDTDNGTVAKRQKELINAGNLDKSAKVPSTGKPAPTTQKPLPKENPIPNPPVVKATKENMRHPGFKTSHLKYNCTSDTEKMGDESFDLRLFVMTFNRAASVKRILSSLNMAQYGTSSVKLEVWIDRSEDGQVDKETLKVVRQFNFTHGTFSVCVHKQHVGIIGQWLIPWKPKEDSHEIAVLLEDDMTVSPYFYKYLKIVHAKYGHMPKVNGFSLQGVSIKHIHEGAGYVDIPAKEKVYLYPTLGTWGFSPNARNWVRFLEWFEKTYPDASFLPLVPNHVGTGWFQVMNKQGRDDSFWEIWHIYHSWHNEEWILYPNFPDHKGLTFNWKENGLHYQGQTETSVDEDKKHLLYVWKREYEILPEVPAYVDNAGKILTVASSS